jgi:thiamine pyrophosphokinase
MFLTRKLLSVSVCLRLSLLSMSSFAFPPSKEWKIYNHSFLHTPIDPISSKKREIALILLNSPALSWKWIHKLWSISSLKICADGSANRLYSLQQTSNLSEILVPNYIKGDLDSLDPSIGSYYRFVNTN